MFNRKFTQTNNLISSEPTVYGCSIIKLNNVNILTEFLLNDKYIHIKPLIYIHTMGISNHYFYVGFVHFLDSQFILDDMSFPDY